MATPTEVSAFLRVSIQTLANWRSLGKGPAHSKAGRLVRYDWADVRQYQENNRKAGAAA
jgi:hypothetical protein